MSEAVFQQRLGKAGDFNIVLTATYDWHSNPNDWDSNSEEYLRAYERGDITFLDCKVSCVWFGIELGESWLGGVEFGGYGDTWTTEDDVAEYIANDNSWMIDEAIEQAEEWMKSVRNLKTGEFVPKAKEAISA